MRIHYREQWLLDILGDAWKEALISDTQEEWNDVFAILDDKNLHVYPYWISESKTWFLMDIAHVHWSGAFVPVH